MKDQITLGLDIGGTSIKAVAVNQSGEVVKHFQLPSQASLGPEAVRESTLFAYEHFIQQDVSFNAIGIGCAGSVDHEAGIVRNSPNFAEWKDIPFRAWIEKASGLRVAIDNDANCAVLAEWKLGAGRDFRNVVLLTLGTGIGGGLILNGQLYRGSTGSAAELGHFSIHANGIVCPCGNSGCFERYCSASALRRKTDGLSPKIIFEKAEEEPFKSLVANFLYDLKIGLTSLANVFDPDCIILGGAVSMGVTKYIDELRGWVAAHAFPAVGANVKILGTRFGHQSGAMGASLLVRCQNQ